MSGGTKRDLPHDDNVQYSPHKKKIKVESRRKRPGITDEIYSETTYCIRNGLRYVKPYYFTFTTHAKGRWVGSKVIDVFCREFQSESPEYYEKAIKAGKVTVNGMIASLDTVVKDNVLITHRVHRHEPPVSAIPLNIIHQDEELLVLDKPASIPVHPCGRYRHNSVVFLLAKEHKLLNLHTVHRLDRLTSGLLLFARSVSKAQAMEAEIRERRVFKVYVCRVKGEFPSEPVVCSEPILVVTHKVGVCRVDPQGKECSTAFTRLSYNGTTSVVRCEPKTGRMHQIRVHLQWLGHPIVNDPIYNHPAWKQPPASLPGGQQSNIERIISEIVRTNYSSNIHVGSNKTMAEPSRGIDGDTHTVLTDQDSKQTSNQTIHCEEQKDDHERDASDTSSNEIPPDKYIANTETSSVHTVGDKEASYIETSGIKAGLGLKRTNSGPGSASDIDVDPDCSECQLNRSDPSPSELLMYLHALSYKGEGWEFSTPPPMWADPNWTEG